MLNVNPPYAKLAKQYAKFNDAPIYYAATILYPYYKYYLEALQKVLDNYNSARDGLYYCDGWLTSNYRAFLAIQKNRKNVAITTKSAIAIQPSKKLRISLLVL